MDPHLFLADVEAVPTTLADFARAVDSGAIAWPVHEPPRRIVLTGMGSSHFAATAAASRLRAHGLDAVAELASAQSTWPPAPDLLVVAISASGSSPETLGFAERHAGTSQVIALTNSASSDSGTSALDALASASIDMAAGKETGGVSCRSYRHTLAALFVLEAQLTGSLLPLTALRGAAAASEYLLDRRDAWLPNLNDSVTTDDGTWFLAPSERLTSASQAALMVREGPGRRADVCETGDWSHVDFYLAEPLDYRAIVFAGSKHEAAASELTRDRRCTTVAVGGPFPGARLEIRYPGDDDEQVALLTEVLVAELLAASWWAASG